MGVRIYETIQRVYAAFKECHDAKFCCDVFTILVKSFHHPTNVTVFSVSANLLWEMLEASKELIMSTAVPIRLYNLFWSVLSPLGLQKPEMTNLRDDSIVYWNICATASQMLTLGLSSYMVSHCDVIEHPSLSRNFESFLLCGFGFENTHNVSLTRLQLACIGDMLGGPAWVFGIESLVSDETRHYLITTAEDFVDTFGRSYFVSSESEEDMEITSIIAGGGAVIASVDCCSSMIAARLCHWEKHIVPQRVEQTRRFPFKTTDLLAIGALMTNKQCPLDEDQAFDSSISYLLELGVAPACWKLSEFQAGLTAGQYLGGQAMGIWKRGRAITLKDAILDKWQGDEYGKLNVLTFPWGLQVSLCTGAARRVPLKYLFDDTLLDIALRPLGQEQQEINTLVRNLFDRPTIEEYSAHINTLSLDDRETIWHVLNATFHTLCQTGVDLSGSLRVWWPRRDTRGFRIGGEWSKVLRDSQCSAVFASVTARCLTLSPNFNCRRDTVLNERIEIRLFQTSVDVDNTNPQRPSTSIHFRESQKYGFGMSGMLRISILEQSRYVFGKWRDLPGLPAAIKSMIFQGYLRERQYQEDFGATIYIQC